MVVGTLLVAERQGFRFICNTYKPQDTELPFMLWVFYLSKILDFTDTYIIIHRKNWNQLSFLHVYHHVVRASVVFVGSWCVWWWSPLPCAVRIP